MKEILFQQIMTVDSDQNVTLIICPQSTTSFHKRIDQDQDPQTEGALANVYMSSLTFAVSYLLVPAHYLMLPAKEATSD